MRSALLNFLARARAALTRLAPRFRTSVKAALAECRARGLDAYVFEGYRSSVLQAHYYARARTIVPPARPVTNARSNLFTWHGYGLAVDVISRSRGWNAGEDWFRRVAAIFRAHGLRWGGEWVMKDLPHFQWGKCKPSPSDRARELHAREGVRSVWRAVGAESDDHAAHPFLRWSSALPQRASLLSPK